MNHKPIDSDDFNGMNIKDVVDALITEINDIKEAIIMDEAMRMKNPALQEAYDKYLVIKRLSE